jgi:plastocyanin
MKKLLTLLFVFISLRSAGFTQRVLVMNTAFEPPFFTVTVGDTILWINFQGTHSVTSLDIPKGALKFSKKLESNGDSLQYIVQIPGDYSYQADLYSSEGMTGRFRVKEKSALTGELLKLQSDRVANYISFDSPKIINIKPVIKDITGKPIKQYPPMDTSQTIYVGDLSNGVYILEIKTGNDTQNLRFVKMDDIATTL